MPQSTEFVTVKAMGQGYRLARGHDLSGNRNRNSCQLPSASLVAITLYYKPSRLTLPTHRGAGGTAVHRAPSATLIGTPTGQGKSQPLSAQSKLMVLQPYEQQPCSQHGSAYVPYHSQLHCNCTRCKICKQSASLLHHMKACMLTRLDTGMATVC